VAAAIVAATTTAQAPSVRLSGKVTTADREPVAGAVVALLTGSGAVPETPTLRQVQPLSSDGRFDWPAIPAGAYRVVVASAEALKDWPAPATVQRFSPRAFPITLTPDPGGVQLQMVVEVGPAPNRDINLITVSTSMTMMMGGPGGPPPGSPVRPANAAAPGPRPMTGPSSISGVLKDQGGLPLVGVPVQAARRQSPAAPSTSAFLPIGMPVTTDATGAYRIAGLQPGAYVVGALPWKFDLERFTESSSRSIPAETDASGQRTGAYTTYYPGATNTRAAQVVTIEPGETRGIDFVVRRGPVTTVTVKLGQPGPLDPRMPGLALAFLMPASVPEQFGQRNGLRAAVDAAGNATFADMQPGQYVFTYFGAAGWVREPVNVAAATSLPLAFTPKPYLTVSGRVDLRPTRVAGGPEVLKTLTVSLTLSPNTAGSPLQRMPVSVDGSFAFPRVPGGPYVLTVAPGGASWVPLSGVIDGQDSLDRPVEISANVTDAMLTVTDVATTVQGRVIGMTSGSVVVFSSDRRFWIPGGSRRVKVATIMPAGVFTVSGLPPGTYHAAAFPEGVRIVNSALEEAKGRTVPFELAIGEQKEIVVR